MPPMTTRTADDEGFITDDERRLLHGAGARRHRPDHRRDGLAREGRPPSPPRGRHLRRPLPARAHAPGRRDPSRRRQGLDPARPRRRPYPHRHLRRDADRALGHPASGLRDHARDHRPGRDDQAAHRRGRRRPCRCGAARAEGRVRLRRDSRRAWLPDLAIPCAVREPAHRRIWRQSREPRALRARRAARGQGGGPRHGGDLPALGRGFLPGRAAVERGPADRDLGGGGRRRRAARHRRALPLAAVGADRAAADEHAGRAFPRIRGRGEAGGAGAGDRGRAARRSQRPRPRRSRPARQTSSRSGAR